MVNRTKISIAVRGFLGNEFLRLSGFKGLNKGIFFDAFWFWVFFALQLCNASQCDLSKVPSVNFLLLLWSDLRKDTNISLLLLHGFHQLISLCVIPLQNFLDLLKVSETTTKKHPLEILFWCSDAQRQQIGLWQFSFERLNLA